jgi:predicted secreted protein
MLYTGVTGYIKVGSGVSGKALAHMSSWEVELSKDIIEVVSFGNDYKEKVPSIKDWSASADGAVDFATDSGQKELINAFEDGTLLTFGFGITETIFMEGTGYIESLTITDEADGNVSLSISVAGSNAITLTTGD